MFLPKKEKQEKKIHTSFEFYKYCLSKGWNRDLILLYIEMCNSDIFIEEDIKCCGEFIKKGGN